MTVGLHPLVVRLWVWKNALVVGLLAVAALVGTAIGRAWWGTGAVAIAAPFLVWLLTRYVRAYARRFSAALLPDGLLVARGVFWRSETFVPRARVQHTDVTQGPLERHFGIASLKVYTAGAHVGVISIDGLAHGSAIALRDALLGRGGPDGV